MRWIAVLCLLAFATSASAASPEQSYFDQRDSYIKKFSSAPNDDETLKQHEAAIDQLTSALRALVGPVTFKGLPAEAKSNVETLDEHDSGFGHLDGLFLTSADYKTSAVVTTNALLQHWLREHRKDGVPQDIAEPFKSGQFYYWAVDDSAFAKYADLPVAKPAAAKAAVAVLGLRSNADLKGTPNEIGVAMILGERIFVAMTSVALKTAPIPACERIWRRMMVKPIDQKDPRSDMKREDEATAAFAQCFVKEAPNQRWFATATAKAQTLVEMLPLHKPRQQNAGAEETD